MPVGLVSSCGTVGSQPIFAALEVAVDVGATVALGVCQRGSHVRQGHALVAPLIRMLVEEARRVHLARGGNPVLRERELGPSGLGTNLLLADVMAPATSGDAHRSAEHEDVHDAAIGVVGLVPLVETSAHEHAGPALGVRGGRRELACRRITSSARTPVMSSCQRGVKGTLSARWPPPDRLCHGLCRETRRRGRRPSRRGLRRRSS